MNLNTKIAHNIESFLKELNIEYIKYPKRITLPCPIHKGDNSEGCSIYYNAEYPYWKCFTHGCHDEGKGMLRFISEILNLSTRETILWLEQRIGKTEYIVDDRYSFIYDNKTYESLENRQIMSRKDFLEKTIRPSQYFVDRGFDSGILQKYDCGTWKVTGEIVIPVYDENHNFVIGYIERSQYKKCCLCDMYHNFSKPCPTTKEEKSKCRKWKNSFAFYSDQSFYNLWFARENIIKSKTVVLVEGQGDIWSLERAGIHNGLGLFGVELKQGQRKILDDLGVQNIILFLDPDEAGQESSNKIEQKFGRYYNFYRLNSKYDPGDSSPEYISKQFSLLGV
jgi:DNA primase